MLEFWDMVGIMGIFFGVYYFFIKPVNDHCNDLEDRVAKLEENNSDEDEE